MPLMKAVQVNAPGGYFRLVDKEIPEPKENEILIKVETCGICRGDAVVKEGRFPDIQFVLLRGGPFDQRLGRRKH